MKRLGLFIVCWWVIGLAAGKAQQTKTDSLQKRLSKLVVTADTLLPDSLKKVQALKDTLKKKVSAQPPLKLNPRKSAYYSLAVPGLGQAYNRQYWKMPIVYAALTTSAFFIYYFNVRYRDFRSVYVASFDQTTGKQLRTEAEVFLRDPYALFKDKGETRTLTVEKITQGKDFYRRYRDLNLIVFAAVWALNVVEANVAAHLKTFDMSEDISLRLEPEAGYSSFTGGVVGAKVVIGFK